MNKHTFTFLKASIKCIYFENGSEKGTDVYVNEKYAGEILNLNVPDKDDPKEAFERTVTQYLETLMTLEHA